MADGSLVVGEVVLRRFVASLFAGAGMTTDDAELVAAALVWTEMRGQGGHGVARIPLYFDFIAKGFLDPKASPEVTRLKPSVLMVEAHRAAGAVAMTATTNALRERARESGLAFALVRNTSHTGAIGYFAEQLADDGLAAIIAVAGPPLMAYHGASAAGVSTSPLALAVPGGDGVPAILLDMATSVAAMGKITEARKAGRPIPPDWALAADGSATTDAALAVLPLPLGGAKGSGLSLLLELMTGVLAGNPIIASAIASEETRRTALNGLQNAMLLAIDVEAFRPIADFRNDAASLAAAIKALPRRPDGGEILLPGERGARLAAERRTKGIPLPPAVWDSLTKLARDRGVATPSL